MGTNVEQFTRNIMAATRRLPAQAVLAAQRKIALDILVSIVLMTPVRKGRARGNWQASVGQPTDGTLDVEGPGAVQRAINDGTEVIMAAAAFVVIYIANNLAYIIPLEHGHSQQAPAGMAAVTLQSVSVGLK